LLDAMVRHRTPIGTAIFAIAAITTYASASWRWFLALPLALVLGLLATVLWGVFLGVLERASYRF